MTPNNGRSEIIDDIKNSTPTKKKGESNISTFLEIEMDMPDTICMGAETDVPHRYQDLCGKTHSWQNVYQKVSNFVDFRERPTCKPHAPPGRSSRTLRRVGKLESFLGRFGQTLKHAHDSIVFGGCGIPYAKLGYRSRVPFLCKNTKLRRVRYVHLHDAKIVKFPPAPSVVHV